MLETVAAGLILAAVSGITYLAYKHAPAFRKIMVPLCALTIAAQFLYSAFNIGVWFAYTKLGQFLDSSKWREADIAMSAVTSRWWIASAITVGFCLYLWFLSALPSLLHEKKEREPDTKRPEGPLTVFKSPQAGPPYSPPRAPPGPE
jgi:hypothetical protein